MSDPVIHDVKLPQRAYFPVSGGNKSRYWFADQEESEADIKRQVEMRGREKI